MYLFNAGLSPNGAPYAGATFDELLPDTPASRVSTASTAFLNPHDLAIKRESEAHVNFTPTAQRQKPGSPSASDGSSQESSSSSTTHRSRHASENYTVSPSVRGTTTSDWSTGISGLKMPSGDDMFGDTEMSGLDADFEVSNQHTKRLSRYDVDETEDCSCCSVFPERSHPQSSTHKHLPTFAGNAGTLLLWRVSRVLASQCHASDANTTFMEQAFSIIRTRGNIQWNNHERRLARKRNLFSEPSIPTQWLFV
jgi:hypothetical protein